MITMSICRYRNEHGDVAYAIYSEGKICPLPELNDENFFGEHPAFESLNETWRNAPPVLLPPTPTPEKIICIGLNYRDHAIETCADIPTEPVVFSKFGTTLIGHGETIRLPQVSSQVDYEAELVVVIGKTAKNVSAAEAMDVVYGYSCGHDVSARDWQKGRPGGQWLLGKSFDTFAPVGPCVVAKTALPDPSSLGIRMRLNDETVQNSTTEQLIFGIPELISHLTKVMTLKPGDLIFTGTPPGVGAARNPPVFLKHGDVCSVEIEGIGTLTNPCQNESLV